MNFIPGTDVNKPHLCYRANYKMWECSGASYCGFASTPYGAYWHWLADMKKAEPWRGICVALELERMGKA